MKRAALGVCVFVLGALIGTGATVTHGACVSACTAESVFDFRDQADLIFYLQVQNQGTCSRNFWQLNDSNKTCDNQASTVNVNKFSSTTPECTNWPPVAPSRVRKSSNPVMKTGNTQVGGCCNCVGGE